MLLQHGQTFFLVTQVPMMLFLVRDVVLDLMHFGLTDAKGRIPGLPSKRFAVPPALMNPLGGVRFQLFHQIGYGQRGAISKSA